VTSVDVFTYRAFSRSLDELDSATANVFTAVRCHQTRYEGTIKVTKLPKPLYGTTQYEHQARVVDELSRLPWVNNDQWVNHSVYFVQISFRRVGARHQIFIDNPGSSVVVTTVRPPTIRFLFRPTAIVFCSRVWRNHPENEDARSISFDRRVLFLHHFVVLRRRRLEGGSWVARKAPITLKMQDCIDRYESLLLAIWCGRLILWNMDVLQYLQSPISGMCGNVRGRCSTVFVVASLSLSMFVVRLQRCIPVCPIAMV